MTVLVILFVLAALVIMGMVAGYRAGRDTDGTATTLWAISANVQGVVTVILGISGWRYFWIGILTFAATLGAHRLGRLNRPPTRPLPSREEGSE